MSPTTTAKWLKENQASLVQEFAALRRRLDGKAPPARATHKRISPPAAIDVLAGIFGLSTFERENLLLCAGIEMDSELGARCAEISGRPQRSAVTFSLAMAVLSDPHWSAIAPSGALRRFRLIEMEADQGITSAPLRIDERILHYLAGINELDERLTGILTHKPPPGGVVDPHWQQVARTIQPDAKGEPSATVVLFCGDDTAGHESLAALVAQRAGRQLFVLRVEDTPASGSDIERFLQLWMRESALLPAFMLLQFGDETPTPAARLLAERLPPPSMIAGRDWIRLARPLRQFEVNKPGPVGQRRLWKDALGPVAEKVRLNIDDIAEQFRLDAATIGSIAASVTSENLTATSDMVASRLWKSCRSLSRPRLESLAERILPFAKWDDLVLPDMQKQMLRRLAAQARHRMTVYEEWGFAAKGRRDLGLSALFAGPSGTGKTLAAEVIAAELNIDLYRIDLSAVVSKYIGETEKNLRRVFDAAESGGALLLFDEADALFGKRSEVKDSHDRYANIEVSYLLQRMESFLGLSILTTNQKDALDKAFARRLRFIVDFPFPNAAQREAIWAQIFPAKTPTKDLQPSQLASLNMTGGNIRNIAVNAAFLAANAGTPVTMSDVLQAAQLEAIKIERPVTAREVKGWVS